MKMSGNRIAAPCAMILFLAACAVTPPDPGLLDNARSAIDQAAAAGAEEYAPHEMRSARARLAEAESRLEARQGADSRRYADEAEIEAQLALARTRAARARAELAERRRTLEQLEANLVAEYGEEVLGR